jgi:hypothetical protein
MIIAIVILSLLVLVLWWRSFIIAADDTEFTRFKEHIERELNCVKDYNRYCVHVEHIKDLNKKVDQLCVAVRDILKYDVSQRWYVEQGTHDELPMLYIRETKQAVSRTKPETEEA